MIGDVLLIEQKHERVARELVEKINKQHLKKLAVSIGGESGSGKSEIAETLRSVLKKEGYKVKILHLDNYYKISPEIRNDYRKKNGVSKTVGLNEIYWDILEENVSAFRKGKPTTIPYIDLYTNQEDRLTTDFKNIDIIIIEGLYACNSSAEINVFIDVTYHETKKAQLKRKKETMDTLRLQVLEKEHQVVLKLRSKTDYFVSPNFTLIDNNDKNSTPEKQPDSKLLVISEHLPIFVEKQDDTIKLSNRADGVCAAIDSIYGGYESLWFGQCNKNKTILDDTEKTSLMDKLLKEHNLHPIFFDNGYDDELNKEFCTKTLRPLFHYFVETTEYREDWWEAYQKYNQLYYEKIKDHINENDTIWVHDYQLLLLPSIIRRDFPDITIGFFLHIPFPSFELFRMIPWRKELLEGLLGADQIGFHTYEYTRHFQSSVFRILGYESKMGNIQIHNRLIHTDSFSLGIDFEKYSKLKKDEEIISRINTLSEQYYNYKIILSIDRLDYTRGILNKISLIESFFTRLPEFRNKVIFQIHIGSPYGLDDSIVKLKDDVEKRVAQCNDKFKTKSWSPIFYSYKYLPINELIALYNIADILLVSSIRDGLNLLTKEYLAARRIKTGVLVLSEFIGGARELSQALLFNPNSSKDFIQTITTALTMPENQQNESYRNLISGLERNTAMRWAVAFMEGLKVIKLKQAEIKARIFDSKTRTRLITDFHTASKRLIIIDYNGTLVPLTEHSERKSPNEDCIDILRTLAHDKKNTIVIISDNEMKYLDKWFNNINIDLIAASDIAYKISKNSWKTLEILSNEWKEEVRPILDKFIIRTPGAHIEEKKYLMTWYYDKANNELGEIRSRELVEDLTSYTASNRLQINEGQRSVEIKNAGLYKGRILNTYFEKKDWDFILAVGDDWTNEPMFHMLPDQAYSIRIGISATEAKYNLKKQSDFIDLLKFMANIK